MSTMYRILDEGSPSRFASLAQNPLLIVFAGMLVPVTYKPLVLVWLLANGWFLGAESRWRQLIIVAASALVLLLTIGMLATVLATFVEPGQLESVKAHIVPYVRLAMFATYFWVLYRLMMLQSTPYALHEYLAEQRGGQ